MSGLSKDTAEFLLGVVYGITLSPGQQNFDELLPRVLKARDELKAIVNSDLEKDGRS